MFSDSIPKGIRIRGFNRYITNATAKLKRFPEATSKELHYAVPTFQEKYFSSTLIHIGINDILKDQSDLQCKSLTQIFWKHLINVKSMVSRKLLYRH